VYLIAGAACVGSGKEANQNQQEQVAPESAGAQGQDQAAPPGMPPQMPSIPAPPDVAAPPADAQKTESGLASKVITPGTGTEKPSEEAAVKVHYTGWTTDGRMFDSSIVRGEPIAFPLKAVIPGWREGVMLMTQGEKRRLWIPPNLAYNGKPGRPQGTLVFDIELIEILKVPETPGDVAAPPADVKKTASGLAYKVLQPGTGSKHPGATSQVQVHYSGWLTTGQMFDSSVIRGKPATFPLARVIPGWTEGLQLMVEGEKTRFWVPVELAYNNRPGAPPGMLVFDVELLKILPDAPPTMPPPGAPPTGAPPTGAPPTGTPPPPPPAEQ